MGKMNGLTAGPEDVFCLIADVLDDILDTSNPTQDYVDELWTSVLLEIRGWKSDASDRDKMLDYVLPYPSDSIANNSILREFIGGSCFKV